MIRVTYNSPSPFGPGWSSGDRRFANDAEFCRWVMEQMEKGPLLITSVKVGWSV